MLINAIKNLLSGMIHSFLIYEYRYQIISLVLLKVFLIGAICLLRKSFEECGYFVVFLLYFIAGLALDVVLLI